MSLGRLIRQRRRNLLMPRKFDSSIALASHHMTFDGIESEQRQWNLRASSILSSCVRQAVLCKQHERLVRTRLTPQIFMTFGIGTALHDWAQNTPALFGSQRRGLWKCLACKRLVFGPPPVRPCTCGASSEAFVYNEHAITEIDGHQIGGHPDILIMDSEHKLRIVEIKTISSRAFLPLIAPLADHRAQIQVYLWAAKTDPQMLTWGVDFEAGYVVYIAKEYVHNDFPVKMFKTKWDNAVQAQVLNRLKQFETGFTGKLPPKHKDCKRITSYKARQCPVRKECFYRVRRIRTK